MTKASNAKIYNIPPSLPFADTLAAGLLSQVEDHPEKLASYLILLPTRRACRSLQEAFLRQSDGKPILLPRLQTFGDIDAEELSIAGHGARELEILPAISPLKRQILLSHTIAMLPQFTRGPAQDMALAKALGQLMDQIYTENLDIGTLPTLVDEKEVSDHWQITVRFLEILSNKWPEVLAEEGVIDAADRRNQLIMALNNHWQSHPPQHPVIAAGSTGSIPATAALLKTISTLPQGSIILPGLDTDLSDDVWDAIEEGHPQATLKQLLNHLEVDHQTIPLWPFTKEENATDDMREEFMSWALRPPEKTDAWQNYPLPPDKKLALTESLKSIKRYDCDTPQDEAGVIALIMRETLETKNNTAALITSDRHLARRVASLCRRWNIEVDDSAGHSLSDSPLGLYLRLCADAAIQNIKPCALLSLLKHEFCHGGGCKDFRSTVRTMEHDLLHGLPLSGFERIKNHFEQLTSDPKNKKPPRAEAFELVHHLEKILNPFIEKFHSGLHDFSDLLNDHLKIAEALATSEKQAGGEFLWRGEAGESATEFLSDLQEHAHLMPRVNGETYLDLLGHFMAGITIRPKYGTHPRLMILGQLEARLIQADRVILAGLNEGNWPPEPAHDPWMSRPMRKKFGLPVPERAITLAAHDFVQGFCNKEVFLTRSKRVDGTPTVPARWLQRIDTFLHAIDMQPDDIKGHKHTTLLKILNQTNDPKPVDRPRPTPPLSARPRKLSVTKIEKWLKDPYSIYAEQILRLRKLDPLEKQPGAAERGNVLHDIMEEFTHKYRHDVPDSAAQDFITISRDVLEAQNYDAEEWYFWMPRMIRLADWIVPHEQDWRKSNAFLASEAEGAIEITEGLEQPFTLTARADRMDRLGEGTIAIIDYKSGSAYSKTKMKNGELPQLSLEALIVEQGKFDKIPQTNNKVGYLGYWKLTGGKEAGEVTYLDMETDINTAIETSKDGLINLVRTFDDENITYLAVPRLDKPPRFNDFEYLERVKEWAALGENSEDAA